MKSIQEVIQKEQRPIKIMQYGEGNFLRAFILPIIQRANEKGILNADVAIIKPIPMGSLDAFKAQDNLYTVNLRGKQSGEIIDTDTVITCVGKVLDSDKDYEAYMGLARLDSLEVVISNTTEAGIHFDAKNELQDTPPATYPGKLTQFLYERFLYFKGDKTKGLVILPVELIENNGQELKACILRYSALWGLEEAFEKWIKEDNYFCNTLVDRIVTGYPKESANDKFLKLNYQDALLDVGEPFGLWVIEAPSDVRDRFPIDKLGNEVVFTDDVKPYRERKVRILNGAHTGTVLAAYLAGKNIVRECMEDVVTRNYMENLLLEVMDTINLPKVEVLAFKNSVFERFENPFINHSLLAIALNSVSKWKSRILPSLKDYYNMHGDLPPYMTFSFAALISFYTPSRIEEDRLFGERNKENYTILDDQSVISFIKTHHSHWYQREGVQAFAACKTFWGEDLTQYEGFVDQVTDYVQQTQEKGMLFMLKALHEKGVQYNA